MTSGVPSPDLKGHIHSSVIVSLLLGLDQFTKAWVSAAMLPGQSIPLVSSILHLTYVQNTGAAFGLFKNQQPVFIGFSLLVIGWILWEICTRVQMGWRLRWANALVLAGAIGNLIDRLCLGYVVDFIDFRVWPVFNVADSAITIGVSCLLIEWWLEQSRHR